MSNILQFPSNSILNQKVKDHIDIFNNQFYQLVLELKQNEQFKQMYRQVTESELTDKDIAALIGNTIGLTLFKITSISDISERVASFLDLTISLNRGLNIFKDTIVQETNKVLTQDQGESNEH